MRAQKKYISDWSPVPVESVYGDNDNSQKYWTAPPEPIWWNGVTNKVEELLDLQPNWDGYGASCMDEKNAKFSILALKNIISSYAANPSVVPISDGGVQYEWHTSEFDIEIIFSMEEFHRVYCYDVTNGQDTTMDILSNNNELREFLAGKVPERSCK